MWIFYILIPIWGIITFFVELANMQGGKGRKRR